MGWGGGGEGITVYLVSAVLRALCDELVVFELCSGVIYLSFSIVLLHNESCERGARRTGRSGSQEMAIQAHQGLSIANIDSP